MNEDQKDFLSSECNYLRDEVKLQIGETNALAKNAILFTAGIITISCIKINEYPLEASMRLYLAFLPLVLNSLMAFRTLTLGKHLLRISEQIRIYEREILRSRLQEFGWESKMKIWRDQNSFNLTDQTVSWTIFWVCILLFSISLPFFVLGKLEITGYKITLEIPRLFIN